MFVQGVEIEKKDRKKRVMEHVSTFRAAGRCYHVFVEKGEKVILSFVRGGSFKKAAHPLAFLSFPPSFHRGFLLLLLLLVDGIEEPQRGWTRSVFVNSLLMR